MLLLIESGYWPSLSLQVRVGQSLTDPASSESSLQVGQAGLFSSSWAGWASSVRVGLRQAGPSSRVDCASSPGQAGRASSRYRALQTASPPFSAGTPPPVRRWRDAGRIGTGGQHGDRSGPSRSAGGRRPVAGGRRPARPAQPAGWSTRTGIRLLLAPSRAGSASSLPLRVGRARPVEADMEETPRRGAGQCLAFFTARRWCLASFSL